MLQTIRIDEKILGRNDDLGADNQRVFKAANVLAVSLLGSPGGGKTSLLERALPALQKDLRVGVIEGDVETERDGRRIAALGVPVAQVVTNGTCHLNAGMVGKVLPQLELDKLDLLFIENVGNLVCPASYWLGEELRIVVGSTTEGEDKPLKYPAMFRKADAMVLNKIDLLPYVPLRIEEAEEYARRVRPNLPIFRTSATTGEGIEEWSRWLRKSVDAWRSTASCKA